MVKYPGGVAIARKQQIKQPKTVRFGKRGMNFEAEINATNDYYLMRGLAVIHKKQSPIHIDTVDKPQQIRANISERDYRHALTADYSGVTEG